MLSVGMLRFCHRILLDEMHTEGLEMRLVLGLKTVLRSCYVEMGQSVSREGDQAQQQGTRHEVVGRLING